MLEGLQHETEIIPRRALSSVAVLTIRCDREHSVRNLSSAHLLFEGWYPQKVPSPASLIGPVTLRGHPRSIQVVENCHSPFQDRRSFLLFTLLNTHPPLWRKEPAPSIENLPVVSEQTFYPAFMVKAFGSNSPGSFHARMTSSQSLSCFPLDESCFTALALRAW